MDLLYFPSDFPSELEPPVTVAVAKAFHELETAKNALPRRKAPPYRDPDPDGLKRLVESLVAKGVQAFASQCCTAVGKGLMRPERAHSAMGEFLHTLAVKAFFDTHPHPGHDSEAFESDLRRQMVVSGEWLGYMEAIAAAEATGGSPEDDTGNAPVRSEAKFLRRAKWLNDEIDRRKLTKYRLQQNGGPDAKTIKRILEGLPVTETSLERLASGLSFKAATVTLKDIPSD